MEGEVETRWRVWGVYHPTTLVPYTLVFRKVRPENVPRKPDILCPHCQGVLKSYAKGQGERVPTFFSQRNRRWLEELQSQGLFPVLKPLSDPLPLPEARLAFYLFRKQIRRGIDPLDLKSTLIRSTRRKKSS